MRSSVRLLFALAVVVRAANPIAYASTADGYVLSAPLEAVVAGSSVRIDLILLGGPVASVEHLPAVWTGRVSDGAQGWPVTLRANPVSVDVPAGGFRKEPLLLQLPLAARGRLVLEIEAPRRLRTVLEVREPAAPFALPTATAADLAGSEIVVPPATQRPGLSRLERYYAYRFSSHEPMYFLFGDEAPAAKFQLSMKYRLLNEEGPLASKFPALKGVHVAFTQRSLWAITDVSSPFFDTSYLPELLFQSLAPRMEPRGGLRWVGWQAAFQHESNGRGGADSRSLNYFYFRPLLVWGDVDGWHLLLRPKLIAYAGDLGDENADIRRYRGYGEARVVLTQGNRLSLSLLGRTGSGFEKGSLQVDLSYPTVFLRGNFAMYLQLQYWSGYGESLLDYNRRSEAVRAGFSLAR